ncbi:uncharacterized protein LOC135692597 isoform X2 [Rhopilema esculentum]|uniref:uncharacterized protein LOC135692597 isoform X2 n=1 Tax=Rhopilema esculentum TaxID=499914 RepID=UPI0031D707C4
MIFKRYCVIYSIVLCHFHFNTLSCKVFVATISRMAISLRVTLELVAKEKHSGKTIDAKKAIDAIKQKDVRDKLAKSKIEIEYVDLAYVDRNTGEIEDDETNVAVVVAVVCVVAFIAVAAVAAFIVLKRRNQGNLNTNLTMTERIAQRGNSKEDLLRSDIMMSNIDQVGMKNMAYSGDVDYRASHVPIDESFMIDVSGKMKNGGETKKPEQIS